MLPVPAPTPALPIVPALPVPAPALPIPSIPVPPAADAGTPAPFCQVGCAYVTDTPPPPAPPWIASSFQTTSDVIVLVAVLPTSVVPPQASEYGLDAGKSTWTPLVELALSLDPLSPAATVTVAPSAAASEIASFIPVMDWAAHEFSGPPQEIETAIGVGLALTASEIASMKPWSVLGAK